MSAPTAPVSTSGGEASVETGHHQPRAFNATDRAILEFERLSWRHTGAKEAEIHTRFAMTPARYYQVLAWILGQPEAMAYDAATVQRLQRLDERRRAVRTRGTVAAGVASRPDSRGVRPALFGGVL